MAAPPTACLPSTVQLPTWRLQCAARRRLPAALADAERSDAERSDGRSGFAMTQGTPQRVHGMPRLRQSPLPWEPCHLLRQGPPRSLPGRQLRPSRLPGCSACAPGFLPGIRSSRIRAGPADAPCRDPLQPVRSVAGPPEPGCLRLPESSPSHGRQRLQHPACGIPERIRPSRSAQACTRDGRDLPVSPGRPGVAGQCRRGRAESCRQPWGAVASGRRRTPDRPGADWSR